MFNFYSLSNMIQYIVRERKDPASPEVQGKYYGWPVTRGVVGLRMLSGHIATRSGHSKGSVAGLIQDIFDAVIHYMEMGYNVDLGMAGRFQLKCSSCGTVTKEECTARTHERTYIHYQPFIKDLKDQADFEQVVNTKPKVEEPDSPGV